MKIGLVSLNQAWLNKEKNLDECFRYIRLASEENCSLIIFPEMTLSSYSLDVQLFVEDQFESNTISKFAKLSKENNINIFYGVCLLNSSANQVANHFCVAEKDGNSYSIYKKIHPFTFAGEDLVLSGGDTLGKIELEGWNIGTTICYDLRFPEIYSILARNSHMGVVIANWPDKRIFHWRTLLVARAIENQMYMVGVNRTGTDGNGLTYERSSMLVSPQGIVEKPLKEIDLMDIYELELLEVTKYRQDFPTVRDKKFPLYKSLIEKNYDSR
ncbi:nitrilase-related carbon-nitrogen hydrolase [Leptospira kanakyensis]|uniref:nitrilase-related carbon-nitrogen hydrolase n=1 Tax=Leptospira kanakyensis TaxID=2484968 RepID=UPI00223E19D3|nr:nitrilase-related carbon-nitrogen hydrolase [Leptospira kanakyensis]MCW7471408.1 carbon-nitrogen family hydrolase [Leptospira kanakyensis]